MKIFFIPHPTENFNHLYTCPRGEAIVRQGLSACPEVTLVQTPEQADYYILDHVPHAGGNKYDYTDLLPYLGAKLVVIDWTDEPDKFLVPNVLRPPIADYYIYFKRSFMCAEKSNETGLINKYTNPQFIARNDIYPISYAILDEFPRGNIPYEEREIDLGCYLRYSCENRSVVLHTMHQWTKSRFSQYNCAIGSVNGGSRSVGKNVFVDSDYFDQLSRTKINVCCGPSWWLGDSRFWESLAAGCLTFIDADYEVLPDYFTGKNCVHYGIYDMCYKEKNIGLSFLRKDLQKMLDNPEEAANIAAAGQKFALEKHTSAARMRYVVDIITSRRKV